MKTLVKYALACAVLAAGGLFSQNTWADCCSLNGCPAQPFIGCWALDLGGGAGWLGVEKKKDGSLASTILWYGGSPVGTASTKVEDGKLVVTRKHGYKQNGKSLTKVETLTFALDGDRLSARSVTLDAEGKQVGQKTFKGKKIPPVPAAPDLTKVKFGDPIPLLNGKDLAGWVAMNPKSYNGWSVKDGALQNRVAAVRKHGTNLRTERTFEDFNLTTEVMMSKNGNSGIYLRGIYEIQMMDSYGKPLNRHNMGALYGRVCPTVAAEKPAGEWQTVDITLVDRHVTVILNGKKIIDNQPALGCTGGAITADEFVPGPIYLQGDHSDVSYRNMVIRPVIK
ncbi:MAG: DUF1080 domain-containing protein [Kiritimatiellae bacterium]|nr:DUF1080 domain-containing protein [Kiritimatiellia bacterium]